MEELVTAVAAATKEKARQRRLVSASYLAKLLGVSERTIWRMEATGTIVRAIRL